MAKKAPKKSTQLVVISLVYIFMGVGSVFASLELFKMLFSGTLPGVWPIMTVLAGVMMFLAGIFGLFRVQRAARAWMGVLIFLVSLVGLVFSIIRFSGFTQLGTSLMQASVSWLFITYNQ